MQFIRACAQFDVEVLIDGVQLAADGEVILELDDDLLADERLEEGVEDHAEEPAK